MSRTNYEAVSDYVGHWLHRAQCLALDRFFRSNQVSNRVSHTVAALLPKIPWRGPGAGLVRVVRASLSRSPTDCDTYLRKLVPKRGWCG